MKRSTVAILSALCALLLLSLPVLAPAPDVLTAHMSEYEDESDPFYGLFSRLFPGALAEETYALPVDFTPGMTPNPANYSETGYQDDSISVTLETREQDGVVYRIVHVTVAHPSQLRTATAGKLTSDRVAYPSSMARDNNAVIAISGDYFVDAPAKTTFEYRQGQKIRAKSNRTKDILIIDELGDFHLFVKSDVNKMKEFASSGRTIVNAFTFGPALVIDGELQTTDPDYGYNPDGKEPRMGIGQLDTLSYVLVLAEGRISNSQGVTHQEFANFMFDLGCWQAFNLDGGNTATMIFNGDYYQTKSASNERKQSDIIYFASAVDPATWQ